MYEDAQNAITSMKPITKVNIQKAGFSPATKFLRMSGHVSTETISEQELYRIVKALSDAMVLALRLAISGSEKEATCKIGESFLSTMT
jgi:hypothetical protein